VILPFFGGYFVDNWGVRVCLLIFTTLLAIGQVVFSFGFQAKSWGLMDLGMYLCISVNFNCTVLYYAYDLVS